MIPDTIERQVEIDAPMDRVWALVSEPGWWINEGSIRPHRLEERGDHVVVHDEKHGAFPIEVVESRQPEYIAFRWLAAEDQAHAADHIETLVEFTLEERDGRVLVRVVESGFATNGTATDEQRLASHSDNSEGWGIEMAALRTHLEPVA